MGWFWSETAAAPVAPHPLPTSNATPPSGCPMHVGGSSPSSPALPSKDPSAMAAVTCPIKATNASASSSLLLPKISSSSSSNSSSASVLSKLNPLNYMPHSLSQERSAAQKLALPTEREASSIPRGDADTNWEYPSPQQMYNAMLRKGYDDTPEDAVESMVAVHNFLNEGAWAEIVEWERRFARGLGYGWRECMRGDDEAAAAAAANHREDSQKPRLLRFQGRPGEMTPKAKILQALGQVYPSKFGGEPPFDRHDWYVQRFAGPGQVREVRYVIDYYSGPPEPTGEPVFYLDVRPAVDGPTAAAERLLRWGGDVWYRASGASVRQ